MPDRSSTSYFGAGPAPLPTTILERAASSLLNHSSLGYGIAELSHRSPEALSILSSAKASLYSLFDLNPEEYDILFMQGGGSAMFSAVVYHMVSIWVEEVRVACERRWSLDGAGGRGTSLSPPSSTSRRPSTSGVLDDAEKFAELEALVHQYLRCDYIVTGSWSLKASQEASRLIGPEYVHVCVDAREHNGGKFGIIPPESKWKMDPPVRGETNGHASGDYVPRQPAFTYYCDNETVDGVEFPSLPSILQQSISTASNNRHLIADMSSNILSRRLPPAPNTPSLIFAGAQKNLGVTGITLVLISRSILPPSHTPASPALLRRLGLPVGPITLDFGTTSKNNSLYNTLPIFDVWIAAEVLKSLEETHGSKGIEGQEVIAGTKAEMLYDALERWPGVYTVVPEKSVRSRMNVCVRICGGDEGVEKGFVKGAEERGLVGLKGHRSVGGIRISNYNAVPVSAIEKLVEYIDDFARARKQD